MAPAESPFDQRAKSGDPEHDRKAADYGDIVTKCIVLRIAPAHGRKLDCQRSGTSTKRWLGLQVELL
jgi:hypothetical protein